MSALKPIPKVTLSEILRTTGKPGRMIWIACQDLYVDDRYQREFREENCARVRRIAQQFDWMLFSPIVVAQAGDGYAVIDGQHRASAAASLGIAKVPAWVVDADLSQQSRIFVALNAATTKVSAMQLWHSRLAFSDPDAIALFAVCRKANVVISRYPVMASLRDPTWTMCPNVIHRLRAHHGDAAIVAALSLLRQVGMEQGKALLGKQLIEAVHKNFATKVWSRHDENAIANKLLETDFDRLIAATVEHAKQKGFVIIDTLAAVLVEHVGPLE